MWTYPRQEMRLTVALPYDSAAKLQEYAHPEMIVTTEWVAEHLDDPGLVVAESDEDVLLYETGHIPGAVNVPWARAVNDDGTFKSADELKAIYETEVGLKPVDDVVAYCRIGERSSLTWFVLTYLLGYPKVRNYDGSWTEWGNSVRVPITRGDSP